VSDLLFELNYSLATLSHTWFGF